MTAVGKVSSLDKGKVTAVGLPEVTVSNNVENISDTVRDNMHRDSESAKCGNPACDLTGKKVKKQCSKCKVSKYCSRNCQIIHWKNGHKEECGKAVHIIRASFVVPLSNEEVVPYNNMYNRVGKLKSCAADGCEKFGEDNVKYKCSRCKTTWYCSRKCQIFHWENGHKEECRVIKKRNKQKKEGFDKLTEGDAKIIQFQHKVFLQKKYSPSLEFSKEDKLVVEKELENYTITDDVVKLIIKPREGISILSKDEKNFAKKFHKRLGEILSLNEDNIAKQEEVSDFFFDLLYYVEKGHNQRIYRDNFEINFSFNTEKKKKFYEVLNKFLKYLDHIIEEERFDVLPSLINHYLLVEIRDLRGNEKKLQLLINCVNTLDQMRKQDYGYNDCKVRFRTVFKAFLKEKITDKILKEIGNDRLIQNEKYIDKLLLVEKCYDLNQYFNFYLGQFIRLKLKPAFNKKMNMRNQQEKMRYRNIVNQESRDARVLGDFCEALVCKQHMSYVFLFDAAMQLLTPRNFEIGDFQLEENFVKFVQANRLDISKYSLEELKYLRTEFLQKDDNSENPYPYLINYREVIKLVEKVGITNVKTQ